MLPFLRLTLSVMRTLFQNVCPSNGWFVKTIALQKVNTLNIRTKQYIIPFYPLHLSKFHIHDPIVFLQCVAHPIRLELNLLNVSFHLFDEILLREPSLTRNRARWSNQSSVP